MPVGYFWQINNVAKMYLDGAGRLLLGGTNLVGGASAVADLTVMDAPGGNSRNGSIVVGGDPTYYGSLKFTFSTGVFDISSQGTGGILTLSNSGGVRFTMDNAGNLLSTGGGIGYGTGGGGTVTQTTGKTNAVTLNKPSGRIIMHNQNLNAGEVKFFTLANSTIGVDDVVTVCIRGGQATPGTYNAWVDSVAASTAVICLRNISAGVLGEAINLSFAVTKGSST